MNRYRHLFLLLPVALALAVVAIAWAGWRAIDAQRENNVHDAQRVTHEIAAGLGRDVLNTLKDILLSEVTRDPWKTDGHADTAVALVGRVMDGGRLVFPWDSVSLADKARAFKLSISVPEFATKRTEADRADYREDYAREIDIYHQMFATSDPNQLEYSHLIGARAFMASNRYAEGIALYRSLLDLPSDVVDEYGHPLALYKDGYVVQALLRQHRPELDRDVLGRVDGEIGSLAALARSGVFLGPILKELLKSTDAAVRVDAGKSIERLSERTAYLEWMRALPEARDLRTALADETLGVSPNVWVARRFESGEEWLIGMTPARAGSSLLVAVRLKDIRERIAIARREPVEFVDCQSGVSLGDNLSGLCAVMPLIVLAESYWIGLPWLFALALAVVGILLPVCLWLLWRDTRREVHVAELRSQFVSSVSHELKTPLTAIRMFAETLQLRAADGPKHAEYLNIIVNESERLTRLLNNVLDFSRMERGQQTYQMQPTALADVVQSVARTMRFPLTEQGFDFRVAVCEDIPPTSVDRDALEQAVLNLLSNAMKYSGEKRDIELRLCRQRGSALIQVADRGVGIAAEDRGRIFEKFYRVQTPENHAVSGAGLGLALVAHIAEAHGGSVEVESAVGQGSTFSIRLPIRADHRTGARANGEES